MTVTPQGRFGRLAAGQGFVEFGLILALALAVAVVVIVFFSPQLAWVLSLIGTEIDRAR